MVTSNSSHPSGPKIDLTGSAAGPVNAAGRDIVNGTVINVAPGATVVVGTQAGQGLQALGEMVQALPEVRAAVISFSASLRAATQQVDRLGDYKDLHDLLHQIQYQCYATIVREATRFPDETSLEILNEYARNLRDILTRLESIVALHRIQPAETAWIQEVANAQAELKTATEALDNTSLKNAVWRLKRILSTQPVRINSSLINSAQALNLPALLEALEHIALGLVDLPIDVDRLDQFRTGLLALRTLNERLQSMLCDHEAWQNLDFELRQVENMLEKDLSELQFSWQMLKTQAAPLYQGCSEQFALDLEKYRQALDEALPSGNPIKIRQAFGNFRHEAGSHFYKIDLDLKALCSELRLVSGPLSVIANL